MQQQLNDITLKFFRYIDKKFRGVNSRLADQDKHIEGLYQLIDTFVQQSELLTQDALIDDARISRLETLLQAYISQPDPIEI